MIDRKDQMDEYDFMELLEGIILTGQDIEDDIYDGASLDVKDDCEKILKVVTFDTAGILGDGRGFIFRMKSGEEFQLQVIRSK